MNTTAQKKNTTGNILYLLLSFFTGLMFFIVIIVGLALGLSTAIIWIGLPILFMLCAAIRGMAAIERSITVGLLHIDIPAPRYQRITPNTWWRRGLANLQDPLTWKNLIYLLFIKFPLGTFTFCVALTLVTASLVMILLPLGYLITTYILSEIGVHIVSNAPAWLEPFTLNITGQFDLLTFVKTFFFSLLGFGLWWICRTLLNGLATLTGELARAMLSPMPESQDTYYYQQQQQQY